MLFVLQSRACRPDNPKVKPAKETEKGKTVYQAHVKKSGGEEVEIKVAEDGKLIDVGKEDDEEAKD
jgi:hypothetical protein